MCLSRMILGKALRCLNALGHISVPISAMGHILSVIPLANVSYVELFVFRKWKDIQCVGCIYDYTDLQDAKYTCIKFFKQMVFGLPIMRINC